MSWQAKDWAGRVIRRAGPLGKARAAREDVLYNLADRHSAASMPFPKVATICRDTGHGERKVQRALAFWERAGALRRVYRRRTSIYWLQLDWLPAPRTVTPQSRQPSPQEGENRHPWHARTVTHNPDSDLTQEGEPRERADARGGLAPALSASPSLGEISPAGREGRREQVRAAAAPCPDECEPTPEDVQQLLDEGYAPEDIPLLRREVAAMWRRKPATWSGDASADFLAAGLKQLRWRRQQPPQATPKPDRAQQVRAAWGPIGARALEELGAAGVRAWA